MKDHERAGHSYAIKHFFALFTKWSNTSAFRLNVKTEITAFRNSLHNFWYVLNDALNSLAHGYIPATLVPPEYLIEILRSIRHDGLMEAIPKDQITAYYGFELVRSTYISKEGLHILVEIPLHRTNGLHRVYKATAIPQPIGGGTTATTYQFQKNSSTGVQ